MIKAIAHLCLRVNDLAKTEEFYCGLLGLEKKFDFMGGGNVIGFYLKVGENNYLEFFRGETAPCCEQPLSHLCLETDDIKGLKQTLDDAGVETSEIKMGADNSWQCWVKDPDGVAIEFHEYTENSSQITGASVEVNW